MAKTLLSSFMEAANILQIEGLSDKDRVEKVNRSPVFLEENKENLAEKEQLDEIEPKETKLEEGYLLNIDGMSCDSCNFKTTAKARNNQASVLKRHKRTAHGEDGDELTTEIDILIENVQNTREVQNVTMDTDVDEPLETKLEDIQYNLSSNVEGISCDACDFKTTAKLKHNQNSVMKRHKRTAHGEDKDGLATGIIVDKKEDIFESNREEILQNEAVGLSCTICGFVSSAKSKNNQQSVMGRHNRKVHGSGEYADIHMSENSEAKEEQMITLDEDLTEPYDEQPACSSDETEESCQICGFKSVAKSKHNRTTVLKRHMTTVHESKFGEVIVS